MKLATLHSRINDLLGTDADRRGPAGWCELDKAHALAAAVVALRPMVCVEIGVFAGRSLLPMALALEAIGTPGSCVIGIDPWTNAAAVEGYQGDNAAWWASVDLNAIHAQFIADAGRLGVGQHVVPVRSKSDDVVPPVRIDLLHIDGAHTDQATRDVQRFATRVRVGGLCFMDDIDWTNASGTTVRTAVTELLKHGFTELYKIGTGAVFQRVR